MTPIRHFDCAVLLILAICFVGCAVADDAKTIDLSIPQFEPKPLVWVESLPIVESVDDDKKTEAKRMMKVADRFKAAGQHDKAAEDYEAALRLDPELAFAAYQAACNFELAGEHQKAVAQFQKAVELGFDAFPTALEDAELGKIRSLPDFKKQLLLIRERYLASGSEIVGQPYAVRPAGRRPDSGWPTILLLHGYGDSNLNYQALCEEWGDLGFVAIAMPGSLPAGDGRYVWSDESTDQTHADLRAALASPLLDGVIDRQRVYLLGFSQGALHAMLLTANYPDQFAGVVGLSPGGSLSDRLAEPTIKKGRPSKCFFIHGDQEPHAPYVKIWYTACQKAGWKFGSATHPGGHQFPENWDTLRLEVAKFLSDK